MGTDNDVVLASLPRSKRCDEWRPRTLELAGFPDQLRQDQGAELRIERYSTADPLGPE